MTPLHAAVVKLAEENHALRQHLVPLLRKHAAAFPSKTPLTKSNFTQLEKGHIYTVWVGNDSERCTYLGSTGSGDGLKLKFKDAEDSGSAWAGESWEAALMDTRFVGGNYTYQEGLSVKG